MIVTLWGRSSVLSFGWPLFKNYFSIPCLQETAVTEWGRSASLPRNDTSSPPLSGSPAGSALGRSYIHCSPKNKHTMTYSYTQRFRNTTPSKPCLWVYQRVSVCSSSELFLQSLSLVPHLQLIHSATTLQHSKHPWSRITVFPESLFRGHSFSYWLLESSSAACPSSADWFLIIKKWMLSWSLKQPLTAFWLVLNARV